MINFKLRLTNTREYKWGKVIPFLIINALILSFYAFYNKYPLVYSDSGTYIGSGFQNIFPQDRPIFYGLFLRHFSLKASLYLIVLSQGLILSYLIYLCFLRLSSTKYPIQWMLFMAVLLTLTTGISFNVSQLMPDVFTSACFLSIILLLFSEKLGIMQQVGLSVLLIFSTIVHSSHFFINTMTLVMVGIVWLIGYRKKKFSIPIKNFCIVFLLIITSYFIVTTTHYIYKGRFEYSEAGHIFRVNKLIETGILKEYLDKNCEKKHYSLCDYRNRTELNWAFMWDAESPINGKDWGSLQEEYDQMFVDIMSNRKYLLKFFAKSMEDTFKQFFCFETGDAVKLSMESAPYYAIASYFPSEKQRYLSSQQANERLDFKKLNSIQYWIVYLSLIITIFYVFALFSNRGSLKGINIAITLLLFLLANAAICSTGSVVNERFQARIIWLLPLVVSFIISNNEIIFHNKEERPKESKYI